MRTRGFAIALVAATLPFLGCASDRSFRNMDPQTQSVVVGRIDLSTFLPLDRHYRPFALHEQNEGRKIRLFPLSAELAHREVQQGYFFTPVPPGDYVLRGSSAKPSGPRDILYVHVPEGKLVNLGTLKAVIDEISPTQSLLSTGLLVAYHFEHVADDSAVHHFEKLYPKAYVMYRDRRIDAEQVPEVQVGRR